MGICLQLPDFLKQPLPVEKVFFHFFNPAHHQDRWCLTHTFLSLLSFFEPLLQSGYLDSVGFELALEGLDFKQRAGMFFSERRVDLQKLFLQVFLLVLAQELV